MKTVVLYESLFGNTAQVARAVAAGAERMGTVVLSPFQDAPGTIPQDTDLLIVGGPTHAWGMTRPRSRQDQRATSYAVGAREWIQNLRPSGGTKAAVFDTRFRKPRWLTGSAAVRIGRRLRRKGYQVVAPPQSFFVEHAEGPLEDGEETRAAAWAEELVRKAHGQRSRGRT